MRLAGRILFPAAVVGATIAGVFGFEPSVQTYTVESWSEATDTVIYVNDGYKKRRTGNFERTVIADSLLAGLDSLVDEGLDTVPVILARDTIKVPDSLRLTDPFRYRYYIALVDSLTHALTRDTLRKSIAEFFQAGDTLSARADSVILHRLDSIYYADSATAVRLAFLAWYNSLDKKARKRYDIEQREKAKMKVMDSLRQEKEIKKGIRDSITQNTPRILESFAVPDSLYYKRIITWTLDDDFQKMHFHPLDTNYNHYYYDYPFFRKDVNASWLGVAGSPVQHYDFFQRGSREGVEFYTAQEPWAKDPRNLLHFNTKTPYTELAYWGTLLAGDEKESDNLHIFTTQNILPSLNFSLCYDRFGGGGILENEKTTNKNFHATINYTGKRYLAHGGYIYNMVNRGENGGVADNFWIRDTTVEHREIKVNASNAQSKIVKHTGFLDQQYRIPFDFAKRIRAKRDTTFHYNPDSLDKNITTAFIGHSTEWSTYTRKYITQGDILTTAGDSLRVMKLDNKLFVKLQPWREDGVVSKLNVGIGDRLLHYYDSVSTRPTLHVDNSFYVYAGIEGKLFRRVDWDAKADYVLAGWNFSDFGVEANARLRIFPFRRARYSPLTMALHAETSLRQPNHYQQFMNASTFKWDNNFAKVSTTKADFSLDIPHWRLSANVGYALLGNPVYYDTEGIIRQHTAAPVSIIKASLREEFVIAKFLHLDNRILFQLSTNQDVVPLPMVAGNLRWFVQFVVQRDETKTNKVMEMQIGINALCNTPWYAPAWNPVLGVFHNQNVEKYTNGPILDLFLNIQWKRACIFVKWENFVKGWPLEHKDYFTADHYISSPSSIKFGLYWPFYIQPHRNSSTGTGPRSASAGLE